MAIGTVIVMTLYLLSNLAYLCALPLEQIQTARDDRVATAALSAIFGAKGAWMMAVAIIVSTFGCNNGLILAGSRVAYAMAKDGLFFRATGKLNDKGVPGTALVFQGIWIVILILLRTRKADGSYGNLYSNLLDYVVFAALLFYVLTIGGIFLLRWKRPDGGTPLQSIWVSRAAAVVYCGGHGDHGGSPAVSDTNRGAGHGDCAAGRAGVLAVVAAASVVRRKIRTDKQKEELHGQPPICKKTAEHVALGIKGNRRA